MKNICYTKAYFSKVLVVTDPWRHYYELSFLFHLLGGSQNPEFKPFLKKRPKYLILGICLGLQSMNVAAGGTLVQDIPLEIYEKNTAEKILNMDENSRHRNYYSGFKIYPDIKSAYPHQLQLISGRWLSLINTGLRFRSLNKKAAKFILSGFRNYINTVILFF